MGRKRRHGFTSNNHSELKTEKLKFKPICDRKIVIIHYKNKEEEHIRSEEDFEFFSGITHLKAWVVYFLPGALWSFGDIFEIQALVDMNLAIYIIFLQIRIPVVMIVARVVLGKRVNSVQWFQLIGLSALIISSSISIDIIL